MEATGKRWDKIVESKDEDLAAVAGIVRLRKLIRI
jgi:hypothetical protein